MAQLEHHYPSDVTFVHPYRSGSISVSLSSHVVPPVWVPPSTPALEDLLAAEPTFPGEPSRLGANSIVCARLVVFGMVAEGNLGFLAALAVEGSAAKVNANGFAHIEWKARKGVL